MGVVRYRGVSLDKISTHFFERIKQSCRKHRAMWLEDFKYEADVGDKQPRGSHQVPWAFDSLAC